MNHISGLTRSSALALTMWSIKAGLSPLVAFKASCPMLITIGLYLIQLGSLFVCANILTFKSFAAVLTVGWVLPQLLLGWLMCKQGCIALQTIIQCYNAPTTIVTSFFAKIISKIKPGVESTTCVSPGKCFLVFHWLSMTTMFIAPPLLLYMARKKLAKQPPQQQHNNNFYAIPALLANGFFFGRAVLHHLLLKCSTASTVSVIPWTGFTCLASCIAWLFMDLFIRCPGLWTSLITVPSSSGFVYYMFYLILYKKQTARYILSTEWCGWKGVLGTAAIVNVVCAISQLLILLRQRQAITVAVVKKRQ